MPGLEGGSARPVYLVDANGNIYTASGGGGGGGGGDASAANQATQIAAEQAIQATAGTTGGAAVVTDANGTLQQYLRGLVKLFAVVARTASMTRPTTSGSVAAGAQTVAFANVGAVNGTVAGTTLKPGETVEFVTHLNDTLGAIAYNPGASGEFLIAEVR